MDTDKLTIDIGFHELVLLTRSLLNIIKMLDQENTFLLELTKENQTTIIENARQRNIASLYRDALTKIWGKAMNEKSNLDPDRPNDNFYLLDINFNIIFLQQDNQPFGHAMLVFV